MSLKKLFKALPGCRYGTKSKMLRRERPFDEEIDVGVVHRWTQPSEAANEVELQ